MAGRLPETSIAAGKLPDKTILEIKPGDFRWRAKVLVVEKGNVHLTKGRNHIQKLILQDAQGSMVEGVMWNKMIEAFASSFIPLNTYSIRGAKVQEIKEQYQHLSPGMTIQWSMGKGTVVVPVSAEAERIPYPPVPTTPLSEVGNIIAIGNPVDIIAAVINIEERRAVPVESGTAWLQELTLIDQSLAPTILTIWEDFLDNQAREIEDLKYTLPIIVCRNIVGSDYAVGTLTTNMASYVTVEPTITEVQAMRTWITENGETIESTQNRRNTVQTPMSVPGSDEGNAAGTNIESKRFDFMGKLSIPDVMQSVPYCICSGCAQKLSADMGEEVSCTTCSAVKKAMPTYKVTIRLERGNNSIEATMFDKIAEQLLEISAEQAHATSIQDLKDILSKINEKFQTKTIMAEIRTSVRRYEKQQTRYAIHRWNEIEEGSASVVPADIPRNKTLQPTGTKNASVAITQERPTTINMSHTPEKSEGKRVRTDANEEETETTASLKTHKIAATEPSKRADIQDDEHRTPSASATAQNSPDLNLTNPAALRKVKLEFGQKQ